MCHCDNTMMPLWCHYSTMVPLCHCDIIMMSLWCYHDVIVISWCQCDTLMPLWIVIPLWCQCYAIIIIHDFTVMPSLWHCEATNYPTVIALWFHSIMSWFHCDLIMMSLWCYHDVTVIPWCHCDVINNHDATVMQL